MEGLVLGVFDETPGLPSVYIELAIVGIQSLSGVLAEGLVLHLLLSQALAKAAIGFLQSGVFGLLLLNIGEDHENDESDAAEEKSDKKPANRGASARMRQGSASSAKREVEQELKREFVH